MDAKKLKEILEIMCAPETTDAPQESDFILRSPEDDIADELFVKNWIDTERR